VTSMSASLADNPVVGIPAAVVPMMTKGGNQCDHPEPRE